MGKKNENVPNNESKPLAKEAAKKSKNNSGLKNTLAAAKENLQPMVMGLKDSIVEHYKFQKTTVDHRHDAYKQVHQVYSNELNKPNIDDAYRQELFRKIEDNRDKEIAEMDKLDEKEKETHENNLKSFLIAGAIAAAVLSNKDIRKFLPNALSISNLKLPKKN